MTTNENITLKLIHELQDDIEQQNNKINELQQIILNTNQNLNTITTEIIKLKKKASNTNASLLPNSPTSAFQATVRANNQQTEKRKEKKCLTPTLKQQFKEAGSIYRDDTDEPTYIYQYKALEIIKEWLTQKRQYVDNHYPQGDTYWNGRKDTFQELLEELNQ